MKKNLLLAGLLTTFSLVAKSQVGINTTNPQGVFNIDGLKNNPTTGVPTAAQAKDDLVTTSNGNLGLGVINPGTTLDVNGAITNRETALAVAGNAATIPVNVSLVRLTGAATANVAISAFAAPNPGQRLIVYNNTTGGFGAILDGVTVPNGKALEFVFSNGFWRSTDGGSTGASSVNIYNADGTLTGNRTVTQGANTLAFTGTQTNAFSVDGNTLSVDAANDRVGLGTTTPDTKLTISTPDNSFGLNHTNGTVNMKTYIGGGAGYVGTTTSNTLNLMTNNGARMTITPSGNVGVGASTPGTTLDVNGAITNRETALAVAGNAVSIPANVSLVRLTGAATANVAISAFAPPNPGQRLIVYNGTTGGFGATLDGVTVPNNTALEFVFSGSFWRSTDGGMLLAGPTNIYTANGTLAGNRTVTTAGNSLSFTNGSNSMVIETTGTEGTLRANGSSKGSVLATGGTSTLNMVATDNDKGIVMTSGNNTGLDIGSYTADPVSILTNNTYRMTVDSGGNVGVGTINPGTTLDVNGAITNRETVLAVAGNAVTIPANVSLVRLTGAATANVAISAFVAPNPGQRLIVYNNTTGGFGATLDSVPIPNNTAVEFVFSNGFWRSTDGGMLIAGPTNIYTANGTLAGNRTVTTAGNSLSFTNGSNSVSVGTTGTEGIVRANGSSRGSFIATGGGGALNMYVDDNGKARVNTTGTTTGMDIGATTADPVNIITNNTQRVIVTSTGSIGVNLPAPHASAILDINGINRGVLLPRVSLTSKTDATTVPTPANGLLVYNNNASMAPYGMGIYYNTGTTAAPNWAKLAPQTSDFQLLDVFTDVATFPVDWAAVGTGNTVDNIDLGLSVFVTIPANSTVKIVIDYNVPMGTSTQGANGQRGYYGVRFLRNGGEAPEGSRKFTVPEGPTGSEMVSLSGKYAETYTNTNAFPVTATYTLNGYVESTTYPVRFNMWSASGDNFNWGKASMVATIFAKDN